MGNTESFNLPKCESQQVEFKTSFLFSNDRKQPMKDQHYNIFRAACSFMNADGGIIYLGIKDDGSVAGLKNDLHAMRMSSLDEYSRYIRHLSKRYFNDDYAVSLIRTYPDPSDTIIIIEVEQSVEKLTVMADGKAYARKGTMTDLMSKEDIKNRKKALSRLHIEENKKNKAARFTIALKEAITDKKKVRLIKYLSGHSDSISDRIVEPINFVSNDEGIWCNELRPDGQHFLKQFKLSRISDMEVLDEGWEFEDEHIVGSTDVFNWTGSEEYHISLMLNVTAKNFLVESYPDSANVLTDCMNGTWLLDTKVHDLNPVCRFCTSWADKVQIFSEELKNAISQFVRTQVIPCIG